MNLSAKISGGRNFALHSMLEYWYKKRFKASTEIFKRLGSYSFTNETATKSQISLYSQTMNIRASTRKADGPLKFTTVQLPSSAKPAHLLALTESYFYSTSQLTGKQGYPLAHYIRSGVLFRKFIKQMYSFKIKNMEGLNSPSFCINSELLLTPEKVSYDLEDKLFIHWKIRGKPFVHIVVAGVVRETFMDLTKTKTGNFANTRFCKGIFD